MPYTKVKREQFEWQNDRLVHAPTGAAFWWSYPNSESEQIGFNWAKAGDVLDNGEDYDRGDIMEMAKVLLAERRREKHGQQR
jgi:hypothetical protein